jgi:hypothetical protein
MITDTDDLANDMPTLPDVSASAVNSPRSLVDTIRARHEGKSPTLDLPIPRWEGDVIVRFKRIPVKAIQASTRRKAAAAMNAVLLAAACEEVFLVDDDGSLRPAREGDGLPAAIRFDGRLADLFQLSADTPEQIVIAMYADDVALGAHAKRVFDWQTGVDLEDLTMEEVDGLAGEADAAT